jgi:pimeloyl-ACP methyl ester carboxylesterase
MAEVLPIVLIPGLLCSPRMYEAQIPALWRRGPVMVADHTRSDSMAGIAADILAAAPPRFALAGLSMGGYIAFEILRQAPERIARLALLDTQARPDTPEQSDRRRMQIDLARKGRLLEVADLQFPLMISDSRHGDERLRALNRQMANDVGPEAFARQQMAIIGRPDSRPDLAAIRCPTLVLVGAQDALTPPDRAKEMAAAIGGARLSVIEDSGHLSTVEQPEAVTAVLEAWLEVA